MLIETDPINDNDDKCRFDEPFIEMIIIITSYLNPLGW